MTWMIDPSKEITKQELLDALCALYAAFFYTNNKSDLQFNAIDLAQITMSRARKSGLIVSCNAKDPEPPKIDLPLFNALS